ncbi:MAG: tetraacyldisaccharide 4'-kinase [Rhodospirillales bacterium 69-11]|nr:MAG: tetraacyldisaccharide 4'-kinase [Rhodospirillales bacterium 69-11]
MWRAPGFWQHDGLMSRLLAPAAAVVATATARRVARPGWRATVPVLCCGNVTVGGAGKTTLVLDLAQHLRRQGVAVHVLLRGYGGRVRGPHRVMPEDGPDLIGDEALLLAAVAPTWVGGDRAASARAAVAAGAGLLLLDDGLQNPTLAKDLSLLVVDGGTGFGNGRVLPAGPLREPVAAGAARCGAAVLIGEDRTGALSRLPPRLPVLHAHLVQDAAIAALQGRRVLAFAGIAHPGKFFTPLAAAGAELVATRPFPDHHAYDAAELDRLLDEADRMAALLVTTPKDAVRLPPSVRARVTVIGVGLAWEDPAARDRLLAPLLQGDNACSTGSASET